MEKKEMLYEGKAKKVYATDVEDVYIVDYKDDATAFNGEKKGTIVGKGVIEGQKVMLVQPQTYMNLSGESVRALMDYYKLTTDEIVIIYDDISMPVGQVRIRPKGSAGGHNGIKNIIAHLGTQEFPRVRIGVGEKPARMDLADYVLGHFNKEEQALMKEAAQTAVEAVTCYIEHGIAETMNRYNGKKKAE